jgi:hypothetical protein
MNGSKINGRIAWHLLYIWIVAIALLFIIEFAFDRRIDTSVLTYLIPGCTVSYLLGRRDGVREQTMEKHSDEE